MTGFEARRIRKPDAAAVLRLLHAAFGFMDGRIDPPSSLHRLTEDAVRDFAAKEVLVAIEAADTCPVACLFATLRPNHVYIGKFATHPDHQRNGLGRLLLDWVEAAAPTWNARYLELQTRIELTENHAYFIRRGFAEVARTAHPGFDRPTSMTMRKDLI